MLTKYSALTLALFLPFVSGLDISVPLTVWVGASVELDVAIATGDPTDIGLLLCVADGSFAIDLKTDVVVAHSILVDIPVDVPARSDYFVAAIEVGNYGLIYSKSNLFEIESA